MRRAVLNLAVLLAGAVSAGSVAMWFRSLYFADDAWVFARRRADNPPPTYGRIVWELNRVVGSSKGRIVWIDYVEPQYSSYSWRDGYYPQPVPLIVLDRSAYIVPPYPAGMTEGNLSGAAEWVSVPSQVIHTRYTTVGRRRYVSVSWLVPAAAGAAVLPVVLLTRRRVWGCRKARWLNRCVGCGYDLRASPGRCPECGTPAAGD
jgi:hypothetical protein